MQLCCPAGGDLIEYNQDYVPLHIGEAAPGKTLCWWSIEKVTIGILSWEIASWVDRSCSEAACPVCQVTDIQKRQRVWIGTRKEVCPHSLRYSLWTRLNFKPASKKKCLVCFKLAMNVDLELKYGCNWPIHTRNSHCQLCTNQTGSTKIRSKMERPNSNNPHNRLVCLERKSV